MKSNLHSVYTVGGVAGSMALIYPIWNLEEHEKIGVQEYLKK